jgi:S-adenosylmethionine:tRNA ribosyltransferase-isomerase
LGGGGVELLLIEEIKSNDWWVMLRPGKRVRPGTRIILSRSPPVTATIHEKNGEGHCRVAFSGIDQIRTLLQQIGEVPLPPYISRAAGGSGIEDRERYQTVFAAEDGSVAAPTAGLHFDEAFISALASAGVALRFVTLHVGLGTFAPVKTELIGDHKMHEERFCIPEETALAIAATRKAGGRVIAVGTTSLRVLESTATPEGRVPAAEGRTSIFIHPPHTFRAVDGLLTNFHLPKSTLLMLVSAFASPGRNDGREWILDAYAEAIRERYRFFSYGDAMLIH